MTTAPLKSVTNRPLRFNNGPGCCIYCGSAGDPNLRDEHIIPDAISGRIKYRKASCAECAVKTGAVEGRVVSRLFGYARAYMMLKRGHRRKWPEKFPVYYTDGPWKPGIIVEEEPQSYL